MGSTPRIIKKYKNRKLYDIETSSYLNLKDVLLMFINGAPLVIIDCVNKEDITNETILKALSESQGLLMNFSVDEGNIIASIELKKRNENEL